MSRALSSGLNNLQLSPDILPRGSEYVFVNWDIERDEERTAAAKNCMIGRVAEDTRQAPQS